MELRSGNIISPSSVPIVRTNLMESFRSVEYDNTDVTIPENDVTHDNEAMLTTMPVITETIQQSTSPTADINVQLEQMQQAMQDLETRFELALRIRERTIDNLQNRLRQFKSCETDLVHEKDAEIENSVGTTRQDVDNSVSFPKLIPQMTTNTSLASSALTELANTAFSARQQAPNSSKEETQISYIESISKRPRIQPIWTSNPALWL
ncbi:hypothetical protein PPYR_02979 [Photinus pyralis]|uniref:Uncharacterized protein n=1 Tax=Photinus pyralis TaxID=7054 RepID=A0A5N4A1L0_PHOPY|nr:hypothetical protein PPYR_02979 [Photinus pyralis]